jgi:hypothetical protein
VSVAAHETRRLQIPDSRQMLLPLATCVRGRSLSRAVGVVDIDNVIMHHWRAFDLQR